MYKGPLGKPLRDSLPVLGVHSFTFIKEECLLNHAEKMAYSADTDQTDPHGITSLFARPLN